MIFCLTFAAATPFSISSPVAKSSSPSQSNSSPKLPSKSSPTQPAPSKARQPIKRKRTRTKIGGWNGNGKGTHTHACTHNSTATNTYPSPDVLVVQKHTCIHTSAHVQYAPTLVYISCPLFPRIPSYREFCNASGSKI